MIWKKFVNIQQYYDAKKSWRKKKKSSESLHLVKCHWNNRLKKPNLIRITLHRQNDKKESVQNFSRGHQSKLLGGSRQYWYFYFRRYVMDISKYIQKSCRLSWVWRQWKYSFFRYWSSKWCVRIFDIDQFNWKQWYDLYAYWRVKWTSMNGIFFSNTWYHDDVSTSRLKCDCIRTRRHSDLLFCVVFWWQIERKSYVFICLPIMSSMLISFSIYFLISRSSNLRVIRTRLASSRYDYVISYYFFRERVRREV